MTFAQAKAIDLIWKTVVSRGMQILLFFISCRVFYSALLFMTERHPISYELFMTVSMTPVTSSTILPMLRAIVVALSPTFIDALSGYRAIQATMLQLSNGTGLDVSSGLTARAFQQLERTKPPPYLDTDNNNQWQLRTADFALISNATTIYFASRYRIQNISDTFSASCINSTTSVLFLSAEHYSHFQGSQLDIYDDPSCQNWFPLAPEIRDAYGVWNQTYLRDVTNYACTSKDIYTWVESFQPWTNRCYRPVKTQATTITTNPNTESPPIRLPPLEISKGLPPPVSGWDAGLDVVDEVLDAIDPFLELDDEVVVVVVGGGPPPIPPSAEFNDVEEDEGVDFVSAEVDFPVTETPELVICSELLPTMDCGVGIEDADFVDVVVLKPNPPVFPWLSVGIVTETAGVLLIATGAVVDLNSVEVVCASAGHKAATIPPFITMPNSVLGLTDTDAQASETSSATEPNPAMQAAEHPLLKSDFLHDGIWPS
ncbi:hypothetical protein EG329_004314 [Mollisiaceae sp. DMI_Dod_QoI]|nr:hypothetical protein EG329_004314 [Helotiales sp. DMI_Dod_QoI]